MNNQGLGVTSMILSKLSKESRL